MGDHGPRSARTGRSASRRRPRVARTSPAAAAAMAPASEAPVSVISPPSNRKIARMSTPTSCTSRWLTTYSASPAAPPWAWRNPDAQCAWPRAGPELIPNVPAASASVSEANRQIAPPRSGRRSGSTPPTTSAPPPAHNASGASTRARPSSQPKATARACPAPPPFQPPYSTNAMNTPSAIKPKPSTSRSTGEGLRRATRGNRPVSEIARPTIPRRRRRGRRRARIVRRRPARPIEDRLADGRLPVGAIPRNFDAERAEPARCALPSL